MKSLMDIGFCKVGEWQVIDGELNLTLFSLKDAKNILYGFVCDGKVLYVGKTTQALNKRLHGYQRPGTTQRTNIRVRKLLLANGKGVEIYALPDNGLLHFGVFHINLAAGLEDSIISQLKPAWNMGGKK
jgi:hypothetical protein